MNRPAQADQGRRIIEQDGIRILAVSSSADVKVAASPQRQQIFRLLLIHGSPLHGKEIATRLGIQPATAHFHLKKLEEIGAVRVSHTGVINGITARYYEPAVDGIIVQDDLLQPEDDETLRQKMLLAANAYNTSRDTFLQAVKKSGQNSPFPVLLNDLVYLSEEDAAAFYSEMENLLNRYARKGSGKTLYTLFASIAPLEEPACPSPATD